MQYAVKCKAEYLPGKEVEYVRCILYYANKFAQQNPRGVDKDIVRRGTTALLELQKANPTGYFSTNQIRSQAGFKWYRGTGTYPWREKYGGLAVVEKKKGAGEFRIVNRFYSALEQALRSS